MAAGIIAGRREQFDIRPVGHGTVGGEPTNDGLERGLQIEAISSFGMARKDCCGRLAYRTSDHAKPDTFQIDLRRNGKGTAAAP